MNTQNIVVDFGKHKGELWTRVPADYLRWLVNQPITEGQFSHNHDMAQAELDRRGTKVSHDVDVSPHAIDKASLRLRRTWHETAFNDQEGIYTWLSRIATEANKKFPGEEKVKYKGIRFVFKLGLQFPVLKTVMPIK